MNRVKEGIHLPNNVLYVLKFPMPPKHPMYLKHPCLRNSTIPKLEASGTL